MRSRKARRSQTETPNRGRGFIPATSAARVSAHGAKAQVHRVSGLHACKRAPDEHGGAVEEARDGVAE